MDTKDLVVGVGAVRINITLPKDTFKKLETICKNEDRPRSNVIKRMIENYFRQSPK